MTMPAPRTKVFISYSHNDQEWLKRVQVHLKPLVKEGLELWDDTQIMPGSQWENEIRNALDSTKVAVLLVSAHFIASDYIAETELPALLAATEKDGASILPVIISPSWFHKTSLARFQAVNNHKPLINLLPGDQEKILVELTERVEAILKPRGQSDASGSGSRVQGPHTSDDAVEVFRSIRSYDRIEGGFWGFFSACASITGIFLVLWIAGDTKSEKAFFIFFICPMLILGLMALLSEVTRRHWLGLLKNRIKFLAAMGQLKTLRNLLQGHSWTSKFARKRIKSLIDEFVLM